MSIPGQEMKYNMIIDVIGQQPSVNVYTQLSLIFKTADGESPYHVQQKITPILESGFTRLKTKFPWIAGEVVNLGLGKGSSGIFSITTDFKDMTSSFYADLSRTPSLDSFDVMKRAGFPGLPDESILSPKMTFPGSPGSTIHDSIQTVFGFQATYIDGGLILTFIGHHQAMDFMGQAHLMRLFSKACRKEAFTTQELSVGNVDRLSWIPSLGPNVPLSHLDAALSRQKVRKVSNEYPGPLPTFKCIWTIFTFSAASLRSLRQAATLNVTDPPGYVSTDDVLTVFLWQSITRICQVRLDHGTDVSLCRAVDVRRYFDGIHLQYPGMMQNCVYHTHIIENLLHLSPGGVASELRRAINPETSDIKYKTRALATYLERYTDKRGVSFAGSLDLTKDVMISSWAKSDVYDLDFGLGLGKPEAVRRPKFPAYESLVYLLPKRQDGEIAVWMCLREEDLLKLRDDEEFMNYAQYVG